MKIEKKKISENESLFYFSTPLPITGTFCAKKNIPAPNTLLNNIYQTNLAEIILLTTDFIYIKAINTHALADLELLTLAEVDDYCSVPLSPQIADNEHTEDKIEIILKTVIAPFLQADGGDIEFISYQNNILSVHFLGKCQGCPYAQRTLQNHVTKNLIHYLPQIKEVKLL